jgi:hypothetical protein
MANLAFELSLVLMMGASSKSPNSPLGSSSSSTIEEKM